AHERFRFFGGVELGSDVERDELFERYHAVVYAVGTRDDRRLGIPGEDRPGSQAATEFVAWYICHPEYADHAFDLSAKRAVVIGNGNVALDVARMLVLEPDASGRLRAVPIGEEETIECGLVLRSIGYRGRPLPGVSFDEASGLIRNESGRMTTEDGRPIPGEYAVGWIKRGPSGVIGTNKKDASETVAKVVEDAEAGRLNEPELPDGDGTEEWLQARVPGLVTW